MNARQAAFYRQAQSDWSVFRHLHADRSSWRSAVQRVWCRLIGVRLFPFPGSPPLVLRTRRSRARSKRLVKEPRTK